MQRPPPRVSEQESQRWQIGNEDEKSFWLGLKPEDFERHEQGYRALARQIDLAARIAGLRPDYRALQIGCAVEDTVFYLENCQRFAVDPLADFYKAHFERSRNPRVDYRKGVGESVPFEDGFFDLVILQNLLDHVANYDVVLDEVKRVLRRPNVLYFGTDVYPQASAEVRWARQARGELFDLQHPHTFTAESLEATLVGHGFRIAERLPPQPAGKGDDSYRHCLFVVWP